MAFCCMFFMRFLMVFGISRSASFVMDCSCIAPLTLAVIVIRGFILHPLFCMALISGSYFVCLWERACSGNLSWQYVNSMNCIVWVYEGSKGVGAWFGAPNGQRMFGLSRACQWHLVFVHVHSRSHYGTMCC